MDSETEKTYGYVAESMWFYLNEPLKKFVCDLPDLHKKMTTQFVLYRILAEQLVIGKSAPDYKKIATIEKEEREKYQNSLVQFMQGGSNDVDVRTMMSACLTENNTLPYVFREMNWIFMSIISASYMSSHTLIKANFETIINSLTETSLPMHRKIRSIRFLDDKQKKYLQHHWTNLNAPPSEHADWLKITAPAHMLHAPLSHAVLSEECIYILQTNLELLIILALEHAKISPAVFGDYLLTGTDGFNWELLNEKQRRYFVPEISPDARQFY